MKSLAKTFAALCCVAVSTACSQQAIDQKLDAYFSTLDGHFMGSVVVQRDGQTIYQRSLGWADVENQIPCTAETQFRIGSISKPFTAVMVLKAANEGRWTFYFNLPGDEPLATGVVQTAASARPRADYICS